MSAPGSTDKLSSLIKRYVHIDSKRSLSYKQSAFFSLEDAVSSIEDAVVQRALPGLSTNAPSAAIAAPAAPTSSALDSPPSVEAWDEQVAPKLKAFADLSSTIGGNVKAQVSLPADRTCPY